MTFLLDPMGLSPALQAAVENHKTLRNFRTGMGFSQNTLESDYFDILVATCTFICIIAAFYLGAKKTNFGWVQAWAEVATKAKLDNFIQRNLPHNHRLKK